MDGAATAPEGAASAAGRPAKAAAGLAALGIVYGDLGTSPLYTYQTIVGSVGGHPSAQDAIGLLSLVVWALIVTVSVKYCVLVMRADNHGEGGILALMSLVTKGAGKVTLIVFGLFGAALIYGDGIITPAISVLSALEGVNAATDSLKPYVLPGAIVILLLLFGFQPRGTASLGRVFGPVMLIWFVVIGVLGLMSAVRHPEVIGALNPLLAISFFARHGWQTFIVLGGVFLAITGGEALYADMGHVGRMPIRLTWYAVVLPSLLLAYAGQTALLIENPGLEGNPFFHLAPGWALVPLVVLATVATIIASQAIITGAFSLTRQAMQLGWFPGLSIRQTSDREYGQIYVPFVNWVMMIGTIVLALGFGSSDRLAGAYGTAVSTTMLLTTALLFNAMRDVWRWPVLASALVAGMLLVVDLVFFGANMLKLLDGGWVPLLFGGVIFFLMTTWHRGVVAVRDRLRGELFDPPALIDDINAGLIPRVTGTAVFLGRAGTAVPHIMIQHILQMKALHETAISLTVLFEEIPRVPLECRAQTEQVAEGVWHITVRFGFVEVPNLAEALACAREQGCPLDLTDAVYFAARDAVVRSTTAPRLAGWRREIFSFMYRNSVRTPDHFDLPGDKFVEVMRQLAL